MPFPCSLSKASVAKRTPLPVAASLPNDPPRSWSADFKLSGQIANLICYLHSVVIEVFVYFCLKLFRKKHVRKYHLEVILLINFSGELTIGFPVTTAGECPWNFEYSSNIQAIVCTKALKKNPKKKWDFPALVQFMPFSLLQDETAKYLWACSHIRCRNICVNSNQIMYFLSEDSSETFELRTAQLPWITSYPAFRPSVRNVSHCCLPCHQLCQGIHLIRVNLPYITQCETKSCDNQTTCTEKIVAGKVQSPSRLDLD